jgi:hypothetical protein
MFRCLVMKKRIPLKFQSESILSWTEVTQFGIFVKCRVWQSCGISYSLLDY